MADSKWTTKSGTSKNEMTAEDVLKLPTYTESRDDRGHSISLSVRVPNKLARILSEQAASGDTPYKTISDYLRDAVFTFTFVCNMKHLAGETATQSPRLMAIEHHRVRLANRIKLRNEAAHYAEQIAALCRTSADEDLAEAARSVAQMVEDVKNDPYAARCYLGCLQQVRADRLLVDHIPEDVRAAIEESSPPPEDIVAFSGLSGAARGQLRALGAGSGPY